MVEVLAETTVQILRLSHVESVIAREKQVKALSSWHLLQIDPVNNERKNGFCGYDSSEKFGCEAIGFAQRKRGASGIRPA